MNIDLLDPASFADGQPHEQFRWLRDNAPVYRHPEPDGPGFWAVTRYEDVKDVGRDPDHYSSMPTIMIPIDSSRPASPCSVTSPKPVVVRVETVK